MLINLDEAAKRLKQGLVIAYPTEAVFGLGCDPFNEQAFNKLLNLKHRCFDKGVILVAGSLKQVFELANLEEEPWFNRVNNSWQPNHSPTTWVLPAKACVPSWITGGRTSVAIRLTHHKETKALCHQFKQAIVSTSANLQGNRPAESAKDCQDTFKDVGVLEGSLGGNLAPSQIWDAETNTQIR